VVKIVKIIKIVVGRYNLYMPGHVYGLGNSPGTVRAIRDVEVCPLLLGSVELYTGSFKKIRTIKTRSREEYHSTTDQIWHTVHSNTSQV
jgi:hypothetical protein